MSGSIVDWTSFQTGWESANKALNRVARDLETKLERFVDDFSSQYRFDLAKKIETRVKSVERAYAKAQKYSSEGRLGVLTDCFGISDAVGARLICRGLDQQDRMKEAFRDGNLDAEVEIDDSRIQVPSPTGYRALHANGVLSVRVEGTEWRVPYEIQVKTLAQDAWGTYTHADAYSRLDLRSDPRFDLIKRLNRLLSSQLHVVDELGREIDRITADVSDRIAREPIDHSAELTYKEVLAILFEEQATLLHYSDAEEICASARAKGIATGDDFRRRVIPRLADASDALRAKTRVSSPSLSDVVKEAVVNYV
jgi:ppGpp synthetase/RelA/SpoT-type nucleotidyltranferase